MRWTLSRAHVIVNMTYRLYKCNSVMAYGDAMAPITPERKPPHRNVPAVSRAIGILRMLARIDEPIGVVLLARRMGMIPSTCLHIVRILAAEGLIAFDPQSKKYRLGAGLLTLGNAYIQRNPFVQLVRKQLDDLTHEHHLAFAAIERSGPDHLIVVAASDLGPGISVRIMTGVRFPALASASGRCAAAFGGYDPGELKMGFGRIKWEEALSFEHWLGEVEEVRRNRYAIDAGHYVRGLTIASVPVFDDQNAMRGCITTIGVKDQLADNQLSTVIAGMQQAACSIGGQLGAELAPHAHPDPLEKPGARKS